MDYLHFASTHSGFRLLLTSIIYPASGKPVPKWVIRTQSPQQLDGFKGQYKNQAPIVQRQPVTIYQYTATFAGRVLISDDMVLGIIFQHDQIILAFLLAADTVVLLKPCRSFNWLTHRFR